MGENNNSSGVTVRTSVAVTDTDGYPKTELYFDSYDKGKCYRGIDEETEDPILVINISESDVIEVI